MPISPHAAFGERIRELRQAAGMTQEDLAERCGLFRTYMSRIETGKANPTLSMIHALATSLGVSVVDLFAAAPPVRKAALHTSRPTPRPTPRPSRGRVTR